MEKTTPEQIRKAREDAGLTQEKAAELIYKSTRIWRYYEAGKRNIGLDSWELFQIKVEQIASEVIENG